MSEKRHDWIDGPRWSQCSRCSTRAHWIEASKDCTGAPKKDDEIGIEIAISRIRSDLETFRFWWIGRSDLGTTRPSLAEWRAEFLEWSRANGASAAP